MRPRTSRINVASDLRSGRLKLPPAFRYRRSLAPARICFAFLSGCRGVVPDLHPRRAAIPVRRCRHADGLPNPVTAAFSMGGPPMLGRAMNRMLGQMLVNRVRAPREIMASQTAFPRDGDRRDRDRRSSLNDTKMPPPRTVVVQPGEKSLVTVDHQFLMQVLTGAEIDRLQAKPPIPHLNRVDRGPARKQRLRQQLRRAELMPSVPHAPMTPAMREQQLPGSPDHQRQPYFLASHFAVLPPDDCRTSYSRISLSSFCLLLALHHDFNKYMHTGAIY